MNLIKLFGIIFFVSHAVITIQCINILGIMPIPSPSHHLWNRVLWNELASKGYNLTVLSNDVDSSILNLTYIHLEETYNVLKSDDDFDLVGQADQPAIKGIHSYYIYQYSACFGAFQSKGFQQLLNYPNDFKVDIIIYDFSLGPCLLGFAEKFNYPPIVGVSAFNNPPYTHQIVGGHKYYAYIPHYGLYYGTNMNFFQRMYNAYVSVYDELYRYYVVTPEIDKTTKTAFRNINLPYASDLENLPALLLVNAHPSIDFPEPTPPNIIQVGGLQIQKPKPLPDDLDKFINTAQKGFILFSLGTNVRSDQLPPAKQQVFLDVMAQFPEYSFLWKFESSLNVKLPKNVKIQKWLPQSDLLGHPKIKAFITHGGLLSTHEAVWFEVPMIAIPFMADQYRNSYRVAEHGIGEKLRIADVTVATLTATLHTILEDPSYRQNIIDISKKFKDRPLTPLDTAVWWIEYIMRHPQSENLKSPTIKLGYMRSNLYDIIAFVLISIALIIILIKKLIFCVIGKWREHNNSISAKKVL